MIDFKFSLKLSIALFAIGTILLGLFAISLSPTIAFIGYAYTALCFFSGFVYMIILIFNLFKGKVPVKDGIKSILVLFINFPVALFYVFVVTMLLNTARITFENNTGYEITSLRVIGCEEKMLPELKIGESTTVWISIPGDCEINIEYVSNGKTKTEVVASYMTNAGGVVATYQMGSNKDIML